MFVLFKLDSIISFIVPLLHWPRKLLTCKAVQFIIPSLFIQIGIFFIDGINLVIVFYCFSSETRLQVRCPTKALGAFTRLRQQWRWKWLLESWSAQTGEASCSRYRHGRFVEAIRSSTTSELAIHPVLDFRSGKKWRWQTLTRWYM